MKVENFGIGLIIAAIGAAIGYADYYIVSMFYSVSSWLAGLVHASEAVATLFTLILMYVFAGILIIIAIFAIIIFCVGLKVIFED